MDYEFPREHPQATTILILGILSLAVCSLIGPFAWNMGNKALAEIDRNPMRYEGRGQVVAGRILGIIATVLIGVSVLFIIIMVMIALAGGGM